MPVLWTVAIRRLDAGCSSVSSSPISSTIHEKSELVPHWERARISCLYQRYHILSLCPRFCLPQNRGLCTFDETFLLLYNSSTNQKGPGFATLICGALCAATLFVGPALTGYAGSITIAVMIVAPIAGFIYDATSSYSTFLAVATVMIVVGIVFTMLGTSKKYISKYAGAE